jgi:isoquinoline 1-oxidoreductase beta subunit
MSALLNQPSGAVSRRGFLKGSAFASGGLLLGFFAPGTKMEAYAAGTVYTPNAWVHIADDNTITLISNQSEMGQGVYTALPMLIAEELNVDIRKIQVAIAPPGKQYVNSLLGGQLTGGSASVRDSWEKLRIGGAQVREMLITAAAQTWNVDRSQLTAVDGTVIGPGGRKATYGQLAEAASKVPVPEQVVLKKPENFRIVGKPTKRLDTPSKSNGTARFGIDVKLPGMVYAAVAQSPALGGSVKSYDDSTAKTMPGVISIVQINDGVAVVADTWWRARKARDALNIVWDDGPAANLSSASMAEGIRKAADESPSLEIIKPVGDVDAAMKTAAKTIKAEYWSQNLAHGPIEPMNFTASYEGGKLHLIGPTQFQQGAVGAVSAVLGVKPEDITVETTFLGGGFGRRLELDFIVQAAQISKAIGKPVKVLWTREDDMTHDFYRPMALNQVEVGLDAGGRPVALKYKLTSQSITQRAFGLPKDKVDPFMIEAAVAAYTVPNSRYEVIHHDAGVRVGYLRSVSHPFNVFTNESLMDEMAASAGKDPIAYRLSLLDDKPRHTRVLRIVQERSDWDKPAPAGRFRGVALMDGYGTVMAMVSEVSVAGGNVTVHRITNVVDLGYMVNPDTVEAQLQSSVAFGLSSALMCEITFENGRAQQHNYDTYPVVRMNQHPPVIDIVLLPSTEKPGGIGEPGAAVIVAATANAVSAAIGKRIRRLPMTPDNIMKA